MLPVECIILILTTHLIISASANRVCERSNYCSNDKIHGYIGPLDTAAQLREAAEATHFRRELIVFGETRLSDAAQTLARFRDAGYAHVLPVMEDASQCHHLKSIFTSPEEGPLSCGTYAKHDPSGQEYNTRFKYLARRVGFTSWWWKWFTVGRAVALGYNVMAVDTDVLVLDDWYWRVKQPPLSEFNMLTQNEWGTSFNGGFSYIQNAASSGPVAWLLFEALHRAVRWAEDDSAIREVSSLFPSRPELGLNDQGILQECLFSAVLGRPIYPSVLAFYGDDKEAYARLGVTNEKMYKAMHDPVIAAWSPGQTYNVSGEMAGVVCERFTEQSCPTNSAAGDVIISTAILKVPHSGGQWPVELGGYPFNRTPGPLTAAYRQAYADLGVQLWPDPEDPTAEAAARATKPERFGYLSYRLSDDKCGGCWAESSWWMTGRHGWWHRHLPGHARSKVAIGHIWANLFPGEYQKEIILMHTGWYSWRVAARMAKSRQRVYIANQFCSNHAHTSVPEVRHVVAYQRGVIHAGLSKEQFVRAVQGLAQVAVALGAIAAWPAAPCDADWALTEEARMTMKRPIEHTVPWSHLDTFYTVQPFGENIKELQCEWAGFTHYNCLCTQQPDRLEVGRGMMAVEFQHLLSSSRAVPSLETTLRLGDNVSTAPPPAGNTAPQAVRHADLLSLNAQSVFLRLQREAMPILWLDRLVDVPDLAGEAGEQFRHWRTKCTALHYLDLSPEERGRV